MSFFKSTFINKLVGFCLIIGTSIVSNMAAATNGGAIPDSLKAWVPWVLESHTDQNCSRVASLPNAKESARKCIWPGQLTVELSKTTAHFNQNWQLFDESWIMLPTAKEHWPTDVLVNNKPARVLEKNGRPVLYLSSGNHQISGTFKWQKAPQYLTVAPETALIRLLRKDKNGDSKEVPAQIDAQNRLWLRDQQSIGTASKDNDQLKVEVFRLLQDDIPMQLETELRLAVAGKPREIVLGQLLPDNSEILQFNSPLPARIEADGRLRIQARAGQWRIYLKARYLQPTDQFQTKKMDALWPDQEIWSFRANTALRGVKVSGAAAIDPSQIDIPPQFANLRTYLLSADKTLTLTQQYRGDASPAANHLSLNRELWLDFDGKGATTRDQINGTFTHGWRLGSSPELQLGRIVANGRPQLVTQMPGEPGSGIEIRHPQVNVEAINRIEPLSAISATGWQHGFDKIDTRLHLPPGWKLWHAVGPDRIQSSWLSSWDLWDLFICLLIVGALFRVVNWQWAAVGALTLALTYHQSGAPLVGWVILVAALPLLKVVPEGKLKELLNWGAHFTLVTLVLVVIGFAVTQIRIGIYPQLERHQPINAEIYRSTSLSSVKPEAAMMEMDSMADALVKKSKSVRTTAQAPYKQRYQAADNVQTGPGQPSWQWQQVRLGWTGPVKIDAPLTLYLSPPWLTRSLKFIQILLVCLLLYGLGGRLLKDHWIFAKPSTDRNEGNSEGSGEGNGKGNDRNNQIGGTTLASILLPLLSPLLFLFLNPLASPDLQAEEFPPPALLQELETRLTKAPDCVPHCAALQSTMITVSDQRMVLRQRISAATALAFPLPFDKSWRPESVLINGKSSSLVKADNKHWINVSAGNHDITITAALTGDNIAIPFPLSTHNTSVKAEGWDVRGLRNGQVTGGSLQLDKKIKQEQQNSLQPAPIKPFVRVQRQLNADLDWELITTVTRIAPSTGAINLRIPLLPGESVVTQNRVVEQQHMLVNLASNQRRMQWRSVIKPRAILELHASNSSDWIEQWQIIASPRWHISGEGIPPVKTAQSNGPIVQLWRPWPGESLKLLAVRPEPVAGPTTTIESIELDHRPGAGNASLKLSMQMLTSLGGDYRIPQPAGAELQSIVIDGREQTSHLQDDHVVLPLRPGKQSVVVSWQLNNGVTQTTITPAFKLPTPANNIDIKLTLPHNRWPIFVDGPDIGPAMLYWGVLAVTLIIAVGLGLLIKRQSLSIPVNTLQWLLLALGMSTVNMAGSIPVVLWFFAMEARRRKPVPATSRWFNISQLGLIGLSAVALLSLFSTIPQSLLSAPDMQVIGNGSSNYFYQWYQDHSSDQLPQAWVFSVPLIVFRIAMLLWSIWIVFALLNWIKWGWQSISAGQLWDHTPSARTKKPKGKTRGKKESKKTQSDEKADTVPEDKWLE
ncbi:MAG: hypothetical protein KUG72_11895 [Pseudomonadales bacterium]|nr:hypothetical protein [Pseudomonadales bacterium]